MFTNLVVEAVRYSIWMNLIHLHFMIDFNSQCWMLVIAAKMHQNAITYLKRHKDIKQCYNLFYSPKPHLTPFVIVAYSCM